MEYKENEFNESTPAPKKNGILREILSWIEIIVLAFIISFVLTRVVIINATVPTSSMENLISPGDRLIGNRLAYKFSEPERFDVIVFSNPCDESEDYIKRLIGLPGETVDIKDAKIYINGSETPLQENYLPEEWVVENDGYHFEIPEGHYLFLGDNRNVSLDARYWAEIALENGLVDTEEESWAYTYVTRDKIKGKALFKYYKGFKVLSDYSE